MSEYATYKTAKASLRPQMPSESSDYFGVTTGINPSENLDPQSIQAAMGLLASICGENYSASNYLFKSQIEYYPAG